MEGDDRVKVKIKSRIATDRIAIAALCVLVVLVTCVHAAAEWETGSKLGFDSNVDRAIDGRRSDSYLSAYLSFSREPGGESRTEWILSTTMEGAVFARFRDLDYLLLTAAPGIQFIPHRTWTIQVSPLVQLKGVKDSDQSSLTFGGRLSMKEQLTKDVYAGQYCIYRDSEAQEEVYSFTENALGAFLGMNWTRAFFTEISYEYSYGDSFQAIGSTSTAILAGHGRGKQRRFSTALDSEIIKEKVDRHSIGISAGIDWTKSLFSLASYTYTTMRGDVGTSASHGGFIGLGYRF